MMQQNEPPPASPFNDPSVTQATTPVSSLKQIDLSPKVPASTKVDQVQQPQVQNPVAVEENLMDEIGNSIKATRSSTILKSMRLINILLGAGTVAVGILSWFQGYADEFDAIVASVYIILFGMLLLMFELRNEQLDKSIQYNFGFMYGYKTRTVFLIFVAIWPLSMGNHWLPILDAVLLFCNAFFNLYVIYNHPDFSGVPPPYVPPSLSPSNTNV